MSRCRETQCPLAATLADIGWGALCESSPPPKFSYRCHRAAHTQRPCSSVPDCRRTQQSWETEFDMAQYGQRFGSDGSTRKGKQMVPKEKAFLLGDAWRASRTRLVQYGSTLGEVCPD